MTNAKDLSKLYNRLTIWERIPLLFAAEARADNAEHGRLFNSSRIRLWHLPEHLLAEQALHVLALIYVGEQLDAAASYFHALWRLADSTYPRSEEWLLIAEVNAYTFTANADAWRRFCTELGIQPESLVAANYFGWFLGYCEENMPRNAPSANALEERIRVAGLFDSQLVSADDLLASWHEMLRNMTGHSPRAARSEEQ
jgi:hypothetical protein